MEVSGQLEAAERDHGTHSVGGWVGLTVGLDAVEKRTNSYLSPESNLGRPACIYTSSL
jgi:hypothetical protein